MVSELLKGTEERSITNNEGSFIWPPGKSIIFTHLALLIFHCLRHPCLLLNYILWTRDRCFLIRSRCLAPLQLVKRKEAKHQNLNTTFTKPSPVSSHCSRYWIMGLKIFSDWNFLQVEWDISQEIRNEIRELKMDITFAIRSLVQNDTTKKSV